jgi:hypothetical protein
MTLWKILRAVNESPAELVEQVDSSWEVALMHMRARAFADAEIHSQRHEDGAHAVGVTIAGPLAAVNVVCDSEPEHELWLGYSLEAVEETDPEA